MKANNIIEFFQAHEELSYPNMYRGQSDRRWPVLPSLARKVDELEKSTHRFRDWSQVEQHIVSEFKKLAIRYMDFKPENRIDWLVHVQHYGLPTILLDFTTSPLKALFFAVENPEHDEHDGCVLSLSHGVYFPDSDEIDETIDEIIAFYPKHINHRVTAQDSCFLAFPFPENLKPFRALAADNDDQPALNNKLLQGHLQEIVIPKKAKNRMRQELTKLGICHKSIFPGLEGIATTIRRSLGWL